MAQQLCFNSFSCAPIDVMTCSLLINTTAVVFAAVLAFNCSKMQHEKLQYTAPMIDLTHEPDHNNLIANEVNVLIPQTQQLPLINLEYFQMKNGESRIGFYKMIVKNNKNITAATPFDCYEIVIDFVIKKRFRKVQSDFVVPDVTVVSAVRSVFEVLSKRHFQFRPQDRVDVFCICHRDSHLEKSVTELRSYPAIYYSHLADICERSIVKIHVK